MRIEDLDYELPEELIAQEPLSERDASRLMVLDVGPGEIGHRLFTDLPALLAPSLFVFNDTRVFRARLHGHKKTGGKVEILLLRKVEERSDRWLAMGRASKALRPDMDLLLGDGSLRAKVLRVLGDGQLEIELEAAGDVDRLVEEIGEVPLPPYIRRPAEEADRARYQTVHARHVGAVAAPTAGLHFTKHSMGALEAAGHRAAFVSLLVGAGTFRPVLGDRLDDHRMHEESYEVPQSTVDAIACARAEGRSVVAVGTTVVRTLESAIDSDGNPLPGIGKTSLFIRPSYRFCVVDHLVTNFHLPRSTLLALVMAFAGVDLTQRAYREGAARKYRFYSYGDATLIRGAHS